MKIVPYTSVLILIIALKTSFLFSQIEKSAYYEDIDGKRLSKESFSEKYHSKPDGYGYFSLIFENDTCYIRKLHRRKALGRLNLNVLDSLKFLYPKMTKSHKFTIFQYYPGKDICNVGHIAPNSHPNHNRNLRKVKKIQKKFDALNYFVYKLGSDLNYDKIKRINWILDKNAVLERLFFQYHYMCGSFVVINNVDGRYIAVFSEYGISTIEKVLDEMSNTK
ncbi:hypothetical protein Q2T40_11900 [Winogradskyella maritima]|uniref:Uncharacterized protein n=1 Tax=Winogradskyella maritima TaxID=1517766 RepID=A0ABV8AKZ1_9FLAO|nr:hypothetical protein [Winogradskyella maritima]